MKGSYRYAVRFVAWFLGLYLGLNTLYGWWIGRSPIVPDVVTQLVTHQTAGLLRWAGEPAEAVVNPTGATVWLMLNEEVVLNVFEGCNGLNVAIVFVAFVMAYGPVGWRLAWFIPVGLLVVHLANLLRIGLLFGVARYYQAYFYYVHKYFFTAALYAVVFILWWTWIYWLPLVHKRRIGS